VCLAPKIGLTSKLRSLGALLMDKMIRYFRTRGIQALVGDVLATSIRMLALARKIGFRRVGSDEPGVVRLALDLVRDENEKVRSLHPAA
jgi:acetyltransferase